MKSGNIIPEIGGHHTYFPYGYKLNRYGVPRFPFFWILLSVGYVLLILGTIPPETLHGGWMGFLGWIYDNHLPPMP